jgi:hypothetical protein
MVGEIGEAETNLMPSGTVKIRGKRFDANSRVGFIARGTVIEVIAMHLGHLVVAPCIESRLKNLAAEPQNSTMLPSTLDESQLNKRSSAVSNAPSKRPDWSLDDEKILQQTLDQSLEGIDLSSNEDEKRSSD